MKGRPVQPVEIAEEINNRLVVEVIKEIIESLADAPIREVRKGIFITAVVSRFCGLSSSMFKELCAERTIDESLPYSDMMALELAQFALSNDISRASLGLAAINSLIDIDNSEIVEINAGEILKKIGMGKNISIIGHFPFTEDLKKLAKNLWVIEKWPRTGDYPEEDAEIYLPKSDIVAISGTTLINHTFSELLRLCPEKSIKMLLGPTTPMSKILFDYGIDILSGIKVIDNEKVLKYISEGANFRQLKRTGSIRLVTMTRINLI